MSDYEEPKYEVLHRGEGWSVRRVDPYTIAEIHVDAGFEKAGRAAFRPLVRYIGGENEGGREMAMTTPVEQRGQVLSARGQTARAAEDGGHDVAFVLPLDVTAETAPEPKDPRIQIRTVPARTIAVLRYSGFWSRSRYEEMERRLVEAVEASQAWAIDGAPVWARFDDPFTLWFWRRNEVQIPVRRSDEGAVKSES